MTASNFPGYKQQYYRATLAQPLSSLPPPPRPFFFSDWNLCFLCNLHVVLLMVTIYLAQIECIIVYQADHYFIPLHLDVSVQH